MNIVAFLFALIGAAFNMFLSVIRTPVPGSTFTGSMYDAVRSVMTNGLPDEGGTVLAILILLVLFLVPLIAAVSGLFIPFTKIDKNDSETEKKRKRRQKIGIILCLCALVNGMAAWGIYYLSSEIFVSPFLSNYLAPYAQKVSFITPAIWAVFYLIAGILVLMQKSKGIDTSKSVRGPSVVFGIRWTDKKNARSDLDASAFLFDSKDSVVANDMIYYDDDHQVHKSGVIWSTGDVEKGNIKQEKIGQGDLEQIIVLLDKVPPEIGMIVFAVTVKDGGKFGDPSSAYARLVDEVSVGEEHIERRTLKVDTMMTGREPRIEISLKNKELDNKDALIVAEIHRKPHIKGKPQGWGCKKIGLAMSGGFDKVCEYYNVKLA